MDCGFSRVANYVDPSLSFIEPDPGLDLLESKHWCHLYKLLLPTTLIKSARSSRDLAISEKEAPHLTPGRLDPVFFSILLILSYLKLC